MRLAKKMQTDLSGTNYKGMIKDLAIERDKILKEEQKKLDSLTGAWADYYNQASNAAVAVRDAARNPDYALVVTALAHDVHHPRFLRVGDAEGLALGGIAVLVGERNYHVDGLTGGPGTL